MVEVRADTAARQRTRASIVERAAELLREQGPAAVTLRAVAEAAGMQAPTIYRFFDDKDALLDAVAEHILVTYVDTKAQAEHDDDPVADLRAGWETHIGFALANAPVFALLNDPTRATRSPAAAAGMTILRERVRRVAAAGRLRVSEDRAIAMIQAGGNGAVLALLAQPPAERDLGLADAMYEAVARTILTDTPALPTDDTLAAAVAFRAVVPTLPTLSPVERALLTEWLDRATATPPEPRPQTARA
jgi:AcrR family transcriptional regulator